MYAPHLRIGVGENQKVNPLKITEQVIIRANLKQPVDVKTHETHAREINRCHIYGGKKSAFA